MQKNGLGSYQFDIKETVRLSHQQLPIEEVEEMELIPQIEIAENGGEIEITGCLYLYGDYKGNQAAGRLETSEQLPESYEESVQFEPLSANRGPFSPLAREDRFEYRIPVQITLPRGKVREVEDVYAYINSFDYELSSPYQIDVQASLVIAGFTEKEEEMKKENGWQNGFEFVHVAGEQFQPEPDSFSQRLKAIEEQAYREQEEEEAVQEATPAQRQQDLSENSDAAEENRTPISANSVQIEDETAEEEVESKEDEREPVEEEQENPGNVVLLPHLADDRVEAEQQEQEEQQKLQELDIEEERDEQDEQDEQEDVRVAISQKGSRKDKEPISSLASIFGKAVKKEAVVEEVEDVRAEQEEEAEPEDNEALYLTNFMEDGGEQFTKLKICILQRNETLEEVAERYEMTVETILRANNAARNQVGAGQLLYIPVKG